MSGICEAEIGFYRLFGKKSLLKWLEMEENVEYLHRSCTSNFDVYYVKINKEETSGYKIVLTGREMNNLIKSIS